MCVFGWRLLIYNKQITNVINLEKRLFFSVETIWICKTYQVKLKETKYYVDNEC